MHQDLFKYHCRHQYLIYSHDALSFIYDTEIIRYSDVHDILTL